MPASRRAHALLLRRLLPAVLVLCLLLQAQAGVLRQWLGVAHWHRPAAAQPAVEAGWWDALQAWRADLLARRPLLASHGVPDRHADRHADWHADRHGDAAPAAAGHHHDHDPTHHHDGTARHHHAAHDATVVALDAAAADGGLQADATAGSLLQPLALSAALRLPLATGATRQQPGAGAAPWQDATLRRLDRPPRA